MQTTPPHPRPPAWDVARALSPRGARRSGGRQPLRARRALALPVAALLVGALTGRPGLAQPAGLQVQAGTATVTSAGSSTLITTGNGPGGFSSLQWQQFSVPANTSVHVAQPGATSLSIQRVTGGAPSEILGALSSNGRLALVNTAGILVGAGAVVDTAGFTASTVNLSDADLFAGRLRPAGGAAAAALEVQGRIVARTGDVLLLGGDVRHSGRIEATSAALEGGRVVSRAVDNATVSGEIVARQAEGARGGGIDVLGREVSLAGTALLDASGPSGGGTIRVGGDYQGANPEVPNAQQTTVAAGAQLRADASDRGDGGRIIAWSDGRTASAGRFSARGGDAGGDGGFVEISGKRELVFASQVDARAPQGRIGKLLLDPEFITISAGGTGGTSGERCPDGQPSCNLNGTSFVSSLEGVHAQTTLQAGYSIVVSGELNWTHDARLVLEAGRSITVNAPITAAGELALVVTGATPAGLDLDGGAPGAGTSARLTVRADLSAASVSLRAAPDPAIASDSAAITLGAAALRATAGALTIESPNVVVDGATVLAASGGVQVTGAMQVTGTGSLSPGGDGAIQTVTINGALSVASGGTLRMDAGGAVSDTLQVTGGTTFAEKSAVVLMALPGASPQAGARYTLVSGATGGELPALDTPLDGMRLEFGSLVAVMDPQVAAPTAVPPAAGSPAAEPVAQAAALPLPTPGVAAPAESVPAQLAATQSTVGGAPQADADLEDEDCE